MDATDQKFKMTEVIKRCVAVIVLMHLCLHAGVVFAVPSEIQNIDAAEKVQFERESDSTTKASQSVFLPQVNTFPDTVGQLTDHEAIFQEERAIPDAFALPRVRHEKQKRHMSWEKDRNSTKERKNKNTERRRKRHRRLGLKQKSCPTRTTYVSKTTAEDIFGQTVDVYPVIQIGKLALDQYFHETFCDVEKCSCAGVNNKKFKSSCQTTYGYTYARIVKGGDIGWSFIKVRSGCSCVIQERKKVK